MDGNGPQQNWTHPVVWLVGGIFAVGVVVALLIADARSPSYALGSELVYRLEIGAVVVGREPSTLELAARARLAGAQANVHAKRAADNLRRGAAALRAEGYGTPPRRGA